MKHIFPVTALSILLLCAACAPANRAPIAHMNAQASGDWTAFSAPELEQNGEAVSITAIVATADGALWFGTAGGPVSIGTGLYRFDRQTWARYTAENGLPADEISSLAAAPDGSLWLTTFCCGVARLESKGGWQYWSTQNGLQEDDARASAVDSQGNVWIGFSENGLARFDGKTWQTFERGYAGRIDPLRDGAVLFSISENSHPRLTRFSSEGWVTLDVPPALNATYVFDIAETPDGTIWFATERAGVFHFSNDIWTQFTPRDGLAGETVLALAVAPDGSLWCGTTNGISRYDGQTWETYYAGKWILSAFAAPDGSLWFGAAGEILRYSPQRK
jgi:ligand-binding sensor domain-containing protein